tara:strand:+ start:7912 stop:8361 length:450 start_codon:yes stop_codon:yes gene_type:complete
VGLKMSSKTIYETFNEGISEQFNAFYKSAETGNAVRIFNKTKETWENLQGEYMSQSIEMAKKAKKQSTEINDIVSNFTQGNKTGEQLESAKKAWKQIINNNKEMIDWLVASNNKSLDILNNHVNTIFDEMVTATGTSGKSTKTTTSSKK